MQVLKNPERTSTDKNGANKHSAASNSDGSSLILVSQGPKLKVGFEVSFTARVSFKKLRRVHL